MSEGGVTLTGLRKTYGDIVAVDGIDLDVDPSEFFVLLGPSGCGKTTTLRMIAGLETPTDGRIHIDGTDVTHTLPRNRDISMVFQSYALYPHKSVRENLRFPLNKMDLTSTEKEQQIVQAAEMLEIEDILDKTPGQLSGGQRQRVAVGRTVVRDPAVFLMDEPLSNLDAKLRVQTRSELRRLQLELKTTTIYVTHDQEEAMSLASRIAIMNDGRIEQIGTPEEVYRNPATAFVAGFLGEPRTNFLDVEREQGTIAGAGGIEADRMGSLPPATAKIGVRPEDLYIVEPQPRELQGGVTMSDPIPFTVDFVEPLGNAYEVTGRIGVTEIRLHLVALAPSVEEGSEVSVALDLAGLHYFDDRGNSIQDVRGDA